MYLNFSVDSANEFLMLFMPFSIRSFPFFYHENFILTSLCFAEYKGIKMHLKEIPPVDHNASELLYLSMFTHQLLRILFSVSIENILWKTYITYKYSKYILENESSQRQTNKQIDRCNDR